MLKTGRERLLQPSRVARFKGARAQKGKGRKSEKRRSVSRAAEEVRSGFYNLHSRVLQRCEGLIYRAIGVDATLALSLPQSRVEKMSEECDRADAAPNPFGVYFHTFVR